MAVGFDRAAVQRDFSAGMFRGVREDLIPSNGAYDITNGLLDNAGAIYRRGGSAYRSTGTFGAATWVPMVWSGFLGPSGTPRTVVGTSAGIHLLNADGTTTALGGAAIGAPGRPTVLMGVIYFPGGIIWDGAAASVATAAKVGSYYAAVGNRLFVGTGDRIDFSDINATGGATTTFNANDFHQLPEGVQILGLAGLRNALLAFTTGGVWVYSNLGYDIVDAAGNMQHREDHYSADLVLWGDAGIAAWEGGLVVPALDAVWVVSLGVTSEAPQAFNRISDPIQALYRDYVRRGYAPGQACVFRGHYLLPILDGSTTVDMLVCRLDAPGQPWSRLAGFGARVASVAMRVSAVAPRVPELIGGSSTVGKVLTLNYFDPSAASSADADGSAYPWSVQTRDMATGPLNKNTIVRLRMGYDLGDPGSSNPVISATQISGQASAGAAQWGRFNWGAGSWSASVASQVLSGQAPEDEYGYDPYTWNFAEKERFGRFRLDCSLPASHLTLRWLEMFVRSNGRA